MKPLLERSENVVYITATVIVIIVALAILGAMFWLKGWLSGAS